MTFTILASVSLLALVSTARPIQDGETQQVNLSLNDLERPDVQNALQSVVQTHIGNFPECLGCQASDVRVHFTSPDAQQAYITELMKDDTDAVRALVPLSGDTVQSADAQELMEILSRLDVERTSGASTPVSDDVVDFIVAKPDLNEEEGMINEETNDEESKASAAVLSQTTPMSTLVLTGTCIAAALFAACVAVTLFVAQILRSRLMTSSTTWDILPHLEKYARDPNSPVSRMGGITPEVGYPKVQMIKQEESSTDDTAIGEKSDSVFNDGTSHPTPASLLSIPASLSATTPADADPPLIPLPHSPSASSPITHPIEPNLPGAWLTTVPTEMKEQSPRVLAFERASAPELDAALAMQLRPGFGLGADAAWLVRFVMSFFGWIGVLLSGGVA
ncbi:hypothetical protein BD410DRAFT_790662 [Rickenella mellea]|uniref:Uncharacterized protein n=1 Tax=Rickenella mellea TaxID=50990 RepID=A0A4Y7Q1F2_9AGAM|nr:hypothetical protein BD410DRAFT_790662 [Rickenella mellea]